MSPSTGPSTGSACKVTGGLPFARRLARAFSSVERIPNACRWTLCPGLDLKVVILIADFDESPRHLCAVCPEARAQNVARLNVKTLAKQLGRRPSASGRPPWERAPPRLDSCHTQPRSNP